MNPHCVMNGTMDKVTEISVTDRKPIVTYAGDKDLFLSLEPTLSSSLPQESTEWRRAYGRAVKSVNVSATFVPFTKDVLPKEGDFHLIDQPMFHTFWTQCSDVEYYKSNLRDDIELWMRVLQQFNLSEWMIVVVETYDFRKSNKLLPRTTVYDKIKSDFGAKHADRCLSVINPLRSESRSAGSWRGLVVNTRLLLLAAFDRILLKFEETIREQRERRIQPGWSFTKYFLLQEELAFVLEMLGVYEEALVQYDELDALFTQFVLNSNLGGLVMNGGLSDGDSGGSAHSHSMERNGIPDGTRNGNPIPFHADPPESPSESPPFITSPEDGLQRLVMNGGLSDGDSGGSAHSHSMERNGIPDGTRNGNPIPFHADPPESPSESPPFITSPEDGLQKTPAWLTQFQSALESWEGLSLTSGVNLKERSRIENNNCSPLQFRNYLFSRQCAMLLYSKKPSEVAERTLPFLHNSIRELYVLEVSCPVGSVPAWVFLSSVEILQICETCTDRNHVEQYSRYTADIWAYARQKLAQLGKLCGLMPGQVPTSEQIHLAVEIFSGLGEANTKPVEKLKRALSNHQEFCKEYLELSELAMGTYKHIGRMRCARSLGQDLSDFYRVLGDNQTAASFLQSALFSYEQDNWSRLSAVTRLRLASSYQTIGDLHRYTKTCLSIACSTELDMATRIKHYEEAISIIEKKKPDPPWTSAMTDYLTLTDIDIQVNQGNVNVSATLGIKSHLPVAATCDSISVAISTYKHESKSSSKHKDAVENNRRKSLESGSSNAFLLRLPLIARFDYQQDKSLAVANVEVKNTKQTVRRQDSHGKYRKVSNIAKADFTRYLFSKNVTLKPGLNSVVLNCNETDPGHYRIGQCCVSLKENFELLSPPFQQKVTFEVAHIPPTVNFLNHTDLQAGLVQDATLRVSSNSFNIPQGSKVKLKTSLGLEIRDESKEFGRIIEVALPQLNPNSTVDIPFSVYAQLPNTRDVPNIDHTIMVKVDWSEEEHPISLKLQPVLSSKLSMHTAKLSKFLHVTISSVNRLSIQRVSMALVTSNNLILESLNPPVNSQIVTPDRKVGFMWKLDAESVEETAPIKAELTLHYLPTDKSSSPDYIYKCMFDVNNYKTIYLLESRVEPSRGSEFCRVSTVCQLRLKVSKVKHALGPVEVNCTSLMYELLDEHNMWAACGRTAGVMSLEEMDEQVVSLDVMPLVNGYLPLPSVRLSKYIPANSKSSSTSGSRSESHLRLEPFGPGQVYNISKGSQVHVISAASPQDT